MGNGLTRQVTYVCPSCEKEKPAWALAKGLPCLQCTENDELERKYVDLMWRVTNGQEQATPVELWEMVAVSDQVQAVRTYCNSTCVNIIWQNVLENWSDLFSLVRFAVRYQSQDDGTSSWNSNEYIEGNLPHDDIDTFVLPDAESIGIPPDFSFEDWANNDLQQPDLQQPNFETPYDRQVKWEGTLNGSVVERKDDAYVVIEGNSGGEGGTDASLSTCRKCTASVHPIRRRATDPTAEKKSYIHQYVTVNASDLRDGDLAYCSCPKRNLLIWKNDVWKDKHNFDTNRRKRLRRNKKRRKAMPSA